MCFHVPVKRICTNAGFPETQAAAEAATSLREEENEPEEEHEAERLWWDSAADSPPGPAIRCVPCKLHALVQVNLPCCCADGTRQAMKIMLFVQLFSIGSSRDTQQFWQ